MNAVSLSTELWLLMRSIQGLRILADLLPDPPGEAHVGGEIPSAISATASILEARLLMLDRAMRDAIDPALVWSHANNAGPEVEGADPDITIRAWSTRKAVKMARAELRRAKLRRQHARARRQRPKP
jgi:hypothetical protein